MTLKGKLKFVDIGPGQWVLHTAGGEVSLFGDIDAGLDGQRVVVEGEAIEGMSAGMMGGKAVSVRTVKASS